MKPAVYDKEYYEKYNNSVTGNCNKAFLEAYLPIFQKHILNGEILEIGCIHPGILNGFKEAGYKTTGIDIFSHELAGHTLLTGDFEKIEFNKRYDIIIASHIFEHFHDPVGAIQKCYNLLNNGGLLFIAMPDPYIIDWSSPYSWGHWHLQEHHIMWNMESFCSELEKDGFKMIMKKRNFGDTFICMGDTHLIAEKEGNLE